MKIALFLTLVTMTQMTFARQVQTDCPMMSESNSRKNTKSDISSKEITRKNTKARVSHQ